MSNLVKITNRSSIEVTLTTRVVCFGFEPFRPKGGAGFDVYLSEFRKIDPPLSDAEIAEARVILQDFARQKNALLTFLEQPLITAQGAPK